MYPRGLTFMLLCLLPAMVSGCVSLQLRNKAGVPYLLGVGRVRPVEGSQGSVYRVQAPGLSLRMIPGVEGASFGWHETTYFVPQVGDHHAPRRLIAFELKAYGIDTARFMFALGFSRLFGLFLPHEGTSGMQFVSHSSAGGSRAWIKEIE